MISCFQLSSHTCNVSRPTALANGGNFVIAQLKGGAIAQTFKCEACGKNFITEWLLKNHKSLCPKLAPGLACPVCDQRYIRGIELMTHMRIFHFNVTKPIFCNRCSFSSDQIIGFTEHYKKHLS